ncbi:MAG: 2-isopropylmalate synthase, partial [Epsilonproteobacteria bacterium]|nr:2-isopropylmalate synthase [Campylobacterota bacterium]
MDMNNNIIIFDTTLRDGEQSPGASMNTEEKIQIALQLEKLGVDVIEAGFAAASPGDADAITKISEQIKNSTVCSLSRALEGDIKAAGEAIAKANKRRIHTFIATSPIHMEYKLKMTPAQVIKKAVDAVSYAKTFCDDVEFSCEDAGRSDIGFLKEILDAVINAGANTLNIPDTVGYRMPSEMGAIIKTL